MNARRPSLHITMIVCFSILFGSLPRASAQSAAGGQVALENLSAGQLVNGFRTANIYLNDAGEAIGARFVHARTGFVLDYLQIESVPQGFIWVRSYPTSDNGEPHTQEHLLLGKGNKGRAVEAAVRLAAGGLDA